MAISAESTSTRILVTINDNRGPFILQRAFYKNRTWLTYTESGFVNIEESEEPIEPLLLNKGDFVDSFELTDGLWEYRCIPSNIENPDGNDWQYTQWIKFGVPDAIGYTFGNYVVPEDGWGEIVTPDDCRYTYLWGTDFKATNGSYFTDEQIRYFIEESIAYLERELNITIVKRKMASSITAEKDDDYDEEEALYDYSERKIQRYGMIQTRRKPIINVTKCTLINRGINSQDLDLLKSIVLDKKKGIIKFLKRPYNATDTHRGIQQSIGRYGYETFQPHLFYAVDYTAGYENSDKVPKDLRQIIGKVAAISLLNVIGDGLMSGFSSSSLSMDGISESFSSTQSATSAYFGARIAVYQKEVENYIKENKYKFGSMPIGTL